MLCRSIVLGVEPEESETCRMNCLHLRLRSLETGTHRTATDRCTIMSRKISFKQHTSALVQAP